MSTLAKNLKDSSGNVILPKTRSEQVYRPNNVTVESSLVSMNTSITNISNDLSKSSSNGYYEVTHSKSGTVHTLSNLPDLTNISILHATFKATADYVAADTISINNKSYTCKLITQEDAPANLFKIDSIVTIHVELSSSFCFFNYGGGSSGPSEDNPPDVSKYEKLIVFSSSSTWTVPQTNWYQIFAIGTAANGSSGGGGSSGNFNYERNGSGGNGGNGGGGGGSSVSQLFLKKDTQIPITVTSSISSFGSYLTANGGSGTTGGSSNGGNVTNNNGSSGVSGLTYSGTRGGDGGNGGYTGISKYRTGSYGNGGTASSVQNSSQYGAMCGAPGTAGTQWTGSSVVIGGGGGGGGGGSGTSWDNYMNATGSGGAGGRGSPGCIIIEKAM